ncbi:MAG: hypothetical protein NTZ05_04955 [Chloroflexi bacterium]|nr:hypothetical protein [Chloroflexota bacterium]
MTYTEVVAPERWRRWTKDMVVTLRQDFAGGELVTDFSAANVHYAER